MAERAPREAGMRSRDFMYGFHVFAVSSGTDHAILKELGVLTRQVGYLGRDKPSQQAETWINLGLAVGLAAKDFSTDCGSLGSQNILLLHLHPVLLKENVE